MKKHILVKLFLFALLLLTALWHAQAAFASPAEALSITRLSFVEDVTGLSQYTPKQGTRFVVGDLCAIYVETTGFALRPTRPNSEDEFNVDLAVDLTVFTAQPRTAVASQGDFSTLSTTVRSRMPATFLAFGFNFDESWTPGNYILELTLRDKISGQSAMQTLTYQLEEATDADRARQAQAAGDQ